MNRLLPLLGVLIACKSTSETPVEADADTDTDTDADTDADTDSDTDTDCAYPAGAVEPMDEGEVISPYSWPTARHMDGVTSVPLDMANMPCANDPEIDWSLNEALMFVSVPAF